MHWQDHVFRSAKTQNHNLGVAGANKSINYFVGLGYVDQEGIELAQNFKRYSVKANSDARIGKRIKIGESFLVSSIDRIVQSEEAIFAGAVSARNQPFYKVYDPNGPSGYAAENAVNRGTQGFSNNLVMRTDPNFTYIKVPNNKILGNVYGELEIIDGLKYRFSTGIDYNVGMGDYFTGDLSFDGFPKSSFLTQEIPKEKTRTTNHLLTFKKSIGNHAITALGGYGQLKFEFNTSSTTVSSGIAVAQSTTAYT